MARNKVSVEHSQQIRCLYQVCGVSGKKLLQMFPQYCKAAIYNHAKRPIGDENEFDKRKLNKGRPPKVTIHDKRRILRTVPNLRRTVGSFTSNRVQVESGMMHVCNRTVRNILHKGGYKYRKSRKKGLLKKSDLQKRVKFCRKVKKHKLTQEFWNNQMSLYIDGKGFQYKQNPRDQARAPKAREWRKKSEGLSYGCTAKGKKEGSINSNFIVGISFSKGVVLCEQYFGPITGTKFADIVDSSFDSAFENSINPVLKRFLMDGCPRQNSKTALRAVARIGGLVFKIPPRSPDLNPIENFFNLVVQKLNNEAIEKDITDETFQSFSERVKRCMLSFPVKVIDKIISTMEKRINMVLKAKGQRIKY